MIKSILTLIVAVCLAGGSLQAEAKSGSNLPTAHDPNSDLVIRYDDWDLILSASVLDVGLSDRRPAGRAGIRNTGTRIVHGNTAKSAHEGNRVFFSAFDNTSVDGLLAIRRDLESVPDFVPLEEFNKSEQLAYWLNLHNVAVMYEVAKAYPIKKIKRLSKGKNNVWDKKSMTVGGEAVSIRDIEEHVITNWNDPLVLYGLFMGAVGGPNVRTTAFTGATVRKDLQANAYEFINSIRGVKLWSGRGRVSDHYKLGARYFPNFETDIKQHLLAYADDKTRKLVTAANGFQTRNYNWGIADLKNGDVYTGSSYYTNPGALTHFVQTDPSAQGVVPIPVINSILSDPDLTTGMWMGSVAPQTAALLRAVKIRNERRGLRGEVTVEEFTTGSGSRIRRSGDVEEDSEADEGGGGPMATAR